MTSQPRRDRPTPPTTPASALPPWTRGHVPTTARERYEAQRRRNDPPWEALPDVARRGWHAPTSPAPVTRAPVVPAAVWLTTATGGRTPDRVCDSLATGQRLCDDFLAALSGEHAVVEDWANLNVPGAPERWVRYVDRNGEVIEQSVAASALDTTGSWFRS